MGDQEGHAEPPPNSTSAFQFGSPQLGSSSITDVDSLSPSPAKPDYVMEQYGSSSVTNIGSLSARHVTGVKVMSSHRSVTNVDSLREPSETNGVRDLGGFEGLGQSSGTDADRDLGTKTLGGFNVLEQSSATDDDGSRNTQRGAQAGGIPRNQHTLFFSDLGTLANESITESPNATDLAQQKFALPGVQRLSLSSSTDGTTASYQLRGAKGLSMSSTTDDSTASYQPSTRKRSSIVANEANKMECFRLLNKNAGDNIIDKTELEEALKPGSLFQSYVDCHRDADAVMRQLDKNNDGAISVLEFLQCIDDVKSRTDVPRLQNPTPPRRRVSLASRRTSDDAAFRLDLTSLQPSLTHIISPAFTPGEFASPSLLASPSWLSSVNSGKRVSRENSSESNSAASSRPGSRRGSFDMLNRPLSPSSYSITSMNFGGGSDSRPGSRRGSFELLSRPLSTTSRALSDAGNDFSSPPQMDTNTNALASAEWNAEERTDGTASNTRPKSFVFYSAHINEDQNTEV